MLSVQGAEIAGILAKSGKVQWMLRAVISGYGVVIAEITPCISIQATRRKRQGQATFAIEQGSNDIVGLLRSVHGYCPSSYLLSVHSTAVIPMAKETLAFEPLVSSRAGQNRSWLHAAAVLCHAVFYHVLLRGLRYVLSQPIAISTTSRSP